jgi:serine/threonine protein kinase
MGELMTRRLLFDGRGSNYTQIEKIYERMGEPSEAWPEVKTLPLWGEIKPRKNYCKNLEGFLRQFTNDITPDCMDLLEKLLTYNPEKRISASAALEHEFFSKEPKMCSKEEFPQFKKEYHYLLLKNNEANYGQREIQIPLGAHEFAEARPPRVAQPANERLSSVLGNGKGFQQGGPRTRDQEPLAKRQTMNSGFRKQKSSQSW